ncbi:MBL fold metallo-hydrolase [Paracoccus sediminis]|uniref:L-ascorbate metabolism protein UlaG, beta-lactamase superfamily n=1 Tax=Paracoccus sediminis TaxID=1214787 RepID=A0A238VNM3_9RHOB|nr:MBL fold metallo-hydrolase [Paracoccus sediminis]TBN52291.1 MBL fold metallo-hydrolase [Paracoccus sediminis]SNR35353.1 L-ascorbate metabolism protein UlaG, beta-lactamase superfamily [Paracoccus sediminis]
MFLSRRASLMLGIASLGATLLPRFALAQTETPASFAFAVEGGQVVFHPVDHASMVVETPGGVIYVDPVGGADLYAGMPRPTLILITHEHGDHFDLPTLQALPAVAIIVNPAVHGMLPADMQSRATPMANGDQAQAIGMGVEAVPAYNTSPDKQQYHPQGRDNGYVLTIGGKRFYIAGDTEDTPEMRALDGIEVAFLPMNLPYTMTVQQAADAVAAFQPGTVVPYHHRGSDVAEFARLVQASDAGSQVVTANWYPRGEAG